jgi:hypothetical protein
MPAMLMVMDISGMDGRSLRGIRGIR